MKSPRSSHSQSCAPLRPAILLQQQEEMSHEEERERGGTEENRPKRSTSSGFTTAAFFLAASGSPWALAASVSVVSPSFTNPNSVSRCLRNSVRPTNESGSKPSPSFVRCCCCWSSPPCSFCSSNNLSFFLLTRGEYVLYVPVIFSDSLLICFKLNSKAHNSLSDPLPPAIANKKKKVVTPGNPLSLLLEVFGPRDPTQAEVAKRACL